MITDNIIIILVGLNVMLGIYELTKGDFLLGALNMGIAVILFSFALFSSKY